ncbi:MAG: (2Fe-2S)-binding protein, partial [Chloroflexi bacterium]|nr:(2Fe-2S)-binding protein [Chloroflexota bacterium]
MSVRLTIDDRPIEIPNGATVLDAINQSGIAIPQLCKDPDRPALGACRTCLVQIDGLRGFPTSCSTIARDGMVVHTDGPDVQRIRRGVLELTAAMLPGFK